MPDAPPDPITPPEEDISLPAVFASSPPLQRIALGLLIVMLGGILLPHTWLLGVPVLAAGGWLATGRGALELAREMKDNAAYLVRGLASLAVFCGAIYQAAFSLEAMVPLFAISFLLLPPRTGTPPALRLPPFGRELLIVVMIGIWVQLLMVDLQDRAAAGMREAAAKAPKPQRHLSPADEDLPQPERRHDSPRDSSASTDLWIEGHPIPELQHAVNAPSRDVRAESGPSVYVPADGKYYPARHYDRSYSTPWQYGAPYYAPLAQPYHGGFPPAPYLLPYDTDDEAPDEDADP